MNQETRVGIGFATGRKSFQKVLKTNIYNWRESGLTEKDRVSLNLFVAYDLKYSNTKASDYTGMSVKQLELIDEAHFIGAGIIGAEQDALVGAGILSRMEARLFFHGGYAAKRNAILYFAMKQQIDYLIFLDDDEYPMAVTNSRSTALWGGQHVLATHLSHIRNADITNGHHCGYVSPIPHISFDDTLTEDDFRVFIGAISNDIINWESVQSIMNDGGVTYADKSVLTTGTADVVEETRGAKFISGANLCVNLTRPERVQPFYNPPKARGEDTFLSTCLAESRVLRVPCYTFHDAFSLYNRLISGVLPIALKPIVADNEAVIGRFYKACVGWIRYKPLLLRITQPESYEEQIGQMRTSLTAVLPKIASFFGKAEFLSIGAELEYYHKNVEKHHRNFLWTKDIWRRLTVYLQQHRE